MSYTSTCHICSSNIRASSKHDLHKAQRNHWNACHSSRHASPMMMTRATASLAPHFGASVSEMRSDVNKAGRNLDERFRTRIANSSEKGKYTKAHRFQNDPSHNQPRKRNNSGLQEANRWSRSMANKDRDSTHTLLNIPREQADHTNGQNNSHYVSLTTNPNALRNSTDPSVRNITRNANEIHTYQLPNRMVSSPNDIRSRLDQSSRVADERIRERSSILEKVAYRRKTRDDRSRKVGLSGVPTREKEVLYSGNDLDKHRIRVRQNNSTS